MASIVGPLIRLGAIAVAFAGGGALVWATLQASPQPSASSRPANERAASPSPPSPRAAPPERAQARPDNASDDDEIVQPKLAPAREMGTATPRQADRARSGPEGEAGAEPRVTGQSTISQSRPEWPSEVSAPTHDQPLQFVVAADNATLNAIREQFLKSPRDARAAFAAHASQQRHLMNLELVTMNVNGEFILVYTGPMPEEPREKAMLARAIANRLNAHPDIRYAEPNYRTRIGEGDKSQ